MTVSFTAKIPKSNFCKFSGGNPPLAPGSKYSNLIGTMSVFNCLYFGHYLSNGAEICQYLLFQAAFLEFKAEITIF